MALPKQIRKQIKQNEEIEGQLRKEQEEAGTQDTAQAEIDALLNEVDPKEAGDTPADNVTELHPTPEGGDPELTPELKPERKDWKQKYSVLKGKYDAEVPRLSQEVRDANSRITILEDKLLGTAPPEAPEPTRTGFTPDPLPATLCRQSRTHRVIPACCPRLIWQFTTCAAVIRCASLPAPMTFAAWARHRPAR